MEEPLLEVDHAHDPQEGEGNKEVEEVDEERPRRNLGEGSYLFDQRDAGAGRKWLGTCMKTELVAILKPVRTYELAGLDSFQMEAGVVIKKIVWVLVAAGSFWVAAVWLCTLTWVQRQLFYAHRIPIWLGQDLDKPETFGFLKNQVAPFYIQTPDGQKLYAWLVVPLGVYAKNESSLLKGTTVKDGRIESTLAFRLLADDPGARIVIYFHGNAGTVGQTRRTEAYRMVSSGASDKTFVLCFDYRGFGKSTGVPTEKGLVIDAIATIEWALNAAKIPPSRIVLLAQSLGTGLASAAAYHFINQNPKIEFAGLLLCAAFSDAATVFLSYSVGGTVPLLAPLRLSKFSEVWFSRQIHDTWKTADHIAALVRRSTKLRLIFLHAKNDHIIPWKQADRLFHIAAGATVREGLTENEIDEKKTTTERGDGGWIHEWELEHKSISEIVVLHGGKSKKSDQGRVSG
ncbi:MAG: hypothetical protein Q9225_005778 [Loekoesia sp. 1 TL-2023]